VRLAYQNLTGPNFAPSQMYDSMCNATFIVPSGALVNGSTNATTTGTGTPSASETGTAPATTATKSEGGRREVGLGLLVFLGALVFAV
jgi:cholinesterase